MSLNTHQLLGVESLQDVLAELHDAKEAVCSITSPATQQDLDCLAASISQLQHLAGNQQQQQQAGDAAATGAVADDSSDNVAGSSSLMKSLTNPANFWRAA